MGYSRWDMRSVLARFKVSPLEFVTTCAVFLCIGVIMNLFGKWAGIAEFKHWWQVATCYLGFVVPLALFVRGYSFPLQYCVCVAAFIPLEVGGYAIGSSIAHENNPFEAAFGVRNFTAVMVAGVGLIPPIGMRIAERVHKLITGRGAPVA